MQVFFQCPITMVTLENKLKSKRIPFWIDSDVDYVVLGHAGIYGNAVGDKLADQAYRRPTTGPEFTTAIDYRMIRAANDE